jgi:hypothetical protein
MQALQKGIESLLDFFTITSLMTQGSDQFGNHLLEDVRIVGQGLGVDGCRRGRLSSGGWG